MSTCVAAGRLSHVYHPACEDEFAPTAGIGCADGRLPRVDYTSPGLANGRQFGTALEAAAGCCDQRA